MRLLTIALPVIAIVVVIGVNVYVRRRPLLEEENKRVEDDRFNLQP